MRKSRILLMLIMLAVAVSFMPVMASAAEKPTLSLKKVTMPKAKDGTGWMWLQVAGTKKKVKWSTSNKKIVSIEKSGKNNKITIWGKKKGKATITAKVGKKKLKCKVTVTKAMSKDALIKLVSYDPSTIEKQYITYTNNSKYYLAVSGTAYLYNADGSQSSDWVPQSLYMKPGESVKVHCDNLYKRPIAEFKPGSAWIWYEYLPQNISAEAQPIEGSYLPVKLTNNGLYDSGNVVATVFFKKGDDIVWTEEKDIFDEPPHEALKPGESRVLNIAISYIQNPEHQVVWDTLEVQSGKSNGHP